MMLVRPGRLSLNVDREPSYIETGYKCPEQRHPSYYRYITLLVGRLQEVLHSVIGKLYELPQFHGLRGLSAHHLR
jgi:hypothetical protein